MLVEELCRNFESSLPSEDSIRKIDDFLRVKGQALTKDFIGIEVEVERIFMGTNMPPIWRNTEDGSLRNKGREFVSLPLQPYQVRPALIQLFTSFNRAKKARGFEFTPRTSTHIHINFRKDTIETVKNVVLLSILFEPLLYSYAGGERDKNVFCLPFQAAEFEPVLRGFLRGDAKNLPVMDWVKYSGVNLIPLTCYGTMEFRHMIGTSDIEKLDIWVKLLLAIKKKAQETNYNVLLEEVKQLSCSSEYQKMFFEVFGDLAEHLYSYTNEKDLDNAVKFLKEILSEKVKVALVDENVSEEFIERCYINGYDEIQPVDF
jgi:Putative amidoligase enzyme